MVPLTPDARRWLAAHHAVASSDQLLERGSTVWTLRRAIERGELEHLGKAVYRLAGAPVTAESRMVAQCLMHPDGFVTGPAAGRLMRWRDMPPDQRISFCLGRTRGVRTAPGIVLRRSTVIDLDVDSWLREDGIRIASARRLVFDLAAHLSDVQLSSVIEDLLHRRVLTLGDLRTTAKRLGGQGRKGSARFGRVLLARLPGGPLESGKEVRLAAMLLERGLPIETQVRLLELPDGSTVRLDFAVPNLRWGIEVDLHSTHLFLEGTTRDKRRDRMCHRIDWQIERVTALDFLDLPACADELVQLYWARRSVIEARAA